MNPICAKHFVDTEFPAKVRALVPSALKTAYDAVDQLYRDVPLFGVTTAKIGKGHVVGWAVDRQFELMIKAGKLKCDYRWAPFEKPTGKYLQLRLGASTMSVSQLPEPTAVPRYAHFRHNRALNNAPFLNLREFDDERRISGLPHLILGHGYQTLTFAQIGVPHWNAKRFGWIYRTPNLLNVPHIIESDEPGVEAADVEAVVTLRNELIRWAHDHANDD